MKLLLAITACWLLAGSAVAQRGGMGGGFRGGMGGGTRGGMGGGFRGGVGLGGRGMIGGGFRPGNRFFFGQRFFNRGFYGFGGSMIYPSYGLGLSYWPGYADYPYDSSYAAYSAYQSSPNVTVIYPEQAQSAPAMVYIQPVEPATRDYDQSNDQSFGGTSPMYLIAFKDRVVRAAIAYWVEGKTLHYITLQHEEKEVPVDSVDRKFTVELNRERHVLFSLPTQ